MKHNNFRTIVAAITIVSIFCLPIASFAETAPSTGASDTSATQLPGIGGSIPTGTTQLPNTAFSPSTGSSDTSAAPSTGSSDTSAVTAPSTGSSDTSAVTAPSTGSSDTSASTNTGPQLPGAGGSIPTGTTQLPNSMANPPSTGGSDTSASTPPSTGDSDTSGIITTRPGTIGGGDNTGGGSNNGGGGTNTGGGSTVVTTGGGGGIYMGSTGTGSGGVSFSSTSPSGQTIMSSCSLLTTYLRRGYNNPPSEVAKLQVFLKNNERANVDVTGFFDEKTELAVNAFQEKYPSVLQPWGARFASGYVYITTTKTINNIVCKQPLTLTSSELAIIRNFKANRDAQTGLATIGSDSLDLSSTSIGTTSSSTDIGSNNASSSVRNTASVANTSFFGRIWNFIKYIFGR